MQQPWEHFADDIGRRLGPAPAGRGTEEFVAASRDAAEALIGWLTGEQGWPWAAARILTAKLVDRAILSVFLEESLDSLRDDLRLIWEAERETDPGREAWQRLVAPLLGTPLPGAPGPSGEAKPTVSWSGAAG